MKRLLPLLSGLMIWLSGLSQRQAPGRDSNWQYHFQRMTCSWPDYHLKKVQHLAGKIKDSSDVYMSLSPREKFTYHIHYLESFWQICSIVSPVAGEKNILFAWLPAMEMADRRWSERQIWFFRTNSDSVIAWMKEDIRSSGFVGLNYKTIIVDLNAKELIPLLIDIYKKKEDHDILTVLMLLMKQHEYWPFVSLPLYRELYEKPTTLGDGYVWLTPMDERLVLDKAKDFYGLHSK